MNDKSNNKLNNPRNSSKIGKNPARMTIVKLPVQNKILQGIPLYIEQGRLDLETPEVLRLLKQQTTS